MRIKEEFKRLGYFWFPSAPKRVAPGILSISDGGNVELEAVGLFDDQEILFNEELKSIGRIIGHIEKDGLVTLDDCYYKTGTITLGSISKSLIHVGIAFIGVNYDESTLPLFNTLTFSIDGIDEWVGISGISVDNQIEERTATISYEVPEVVPLNLGNGMQLLIRFEGTVPVSPIIKEARISQKTYFTLVSQAARELDDFLSVVHKITNFLCFAIDQTVSLDGISATSDNLFRDVGDGTTKPIPINIYYLSRPYSKDEPKIYPHHMLFRFRQIQNDAERIINNWIEAYENITPAFNQYFLAKMGEQTYLEGRFMALAQGLEAYHRRTSDEKRMDDAEFEELVKNLIDQCPEEYRKWLGDKLNYGNEVSLRNRIKRMIEPFKDIIGTGKKRRELIENIVVTRNYLTHYDQSLESEAAQGDALWSLYLKMELLFQLHLLHLIGFNREEINSIMTNCEQLQWKRNQ